MGRHTLATNQEIKKITMMTDPETLVIDWEKDGKPQQFYFNAFVNDIKEATAVIICGAMGNW